MRLLVAESEPAAGRRARRQSVGKSSGETYVAVLERLAPDARIERITPADADGRRPGGGELAAYDAVFLTGSPLHLYQDVPETRREVEFMRAVYASGTPAFGSCAGLQLATVAAGGVVRPMPAPHEAGFARRITRTAAGAAHPLLEGRPEAYDAPAIHSDEVARLPEGGTLLARNRVTEVQAAEIRCGAGVFWGVQYHPEISLHEVAAALRRQADDLIGQALSPDRPTLEAHAALIDELDREPVRRDLAWRLGLDEEVVRFERRTTEIRNFITSLVRPTASARSRI